MKIKFAFNESKALEALAFLANEHPGLTPLFISKILFYAEKWHLNRFGRPVFADTYIAMPLGPVPSTIKNYLDQNWQWVEEPNGFGDAVRIERGYGLPKLMPANRKPNLEVLSDTDVECLRKAIAFCVGKTSAELSELTHFEKAWRNADANQPMDYADFVDDDNPNRVEILAMVQESAAYGVL